MEATLSLSDFPDRISPMVVKELRQGLRTRLFGGVLGVLHALLVLLTLINGSSGNDPTAQIWFDGLVTLVLCVILPLRGFSAMADELKAGTLDMLVLTKLSAGRIVFGKWASVVSQSLLIALSILPYVVSQYLFGGVELFGEMLMLFYKWLAGAVIASVIVALSTQRQFWLRAVVVGLPMLIGGCGMLSYFVASRFGFRGSSPMAGVLGMAGFPVGVGTQIAAIVAFAAWLIFFFLSLAATRHAPAASLLSVVKRTVHFCAVCIVLVIGLVWRSSFAVQVAGFMLPLVMMDALTERVNEVPSVYAPFYRRGLVGRLLLWLLAPGWFTGSLFTGLLALLTVAVSAAVGRIEGTLMVVSGCCASWMVAALIQLFPHTRRARDLFVSYLFYSFGLQLIFGLLATLVLETYRLSGLTPWFTSAIPQFVPLGYAIVPAAERESFLMLSLALSLFWPALLFVEGLLAWRGLRHVRREAWASIQPVKGGAEI